MAERDYLNISVENRFNLSFDLNKWESSLDIPQFGIIEQEFRDASTNRVICVNLGWAFNIYRTDERIFDATDGGRVEFEENDFPVEIVDSLTDATLKLDLTDGPPESLSIGAKLLDPNPTLSASIALEEPTTQSQWLQ